MPRRRLIFTMMSRPTQRTSFLSTVEPLESRKLLTTVFLADLPADPIAVAAGDDPYVRLIGTETAETIEFAAESDAVDGPITRLDVFLNGELRVQITVDDDLQRVEVQAGDGDDTIIGGRNLPVPAVFEGQGGNDLIGGSRRGDVLLGGDGNDTLDGNAGGDLLSGNSGDDLLLPGQLSAGAGLVLDGGDIDGEGVFLTDGNGGRITLRDSAPFDATVEYDALGESGRLFTGNLSLLDADYTFGGDGNDTAEVHARTFLGTGVEDVALGFDGPLVTPMVCQLSPDVQLRGDTNDNLAEAAVVATARATESADPDALAEDIDDLVDDLDMLAGAFDYDFTVETSTNGGAGGLFSRTLVFDVTQVDADPITVADALQEAADGLQSAVLAAGEAQRRYVPQTFAYDNVTITYDPAAGTLEAILDEDD